MMRILDTVIIGAGQAGLAAGYQLQRQQFTFQILEANEAVGGAWPHYYDSLTLFSPARYSSLPGLPFAGDPDRYPRRDEVVAYLRSYAAHFQLPVRTRTPVQQVTQDGGRFIVTTAAGEQIPAYSLIAATGSFSHPYIPGIPGHAAFAGQVLHAADYRNPSLFRGQRVIVVGAGNSAVQIAVELAREADVTLATRGRVRFVPQRFLGRDFHFWLRALRLDQSPWLSDVSTPVLDTGIYREAVQAGRPPRRPMFTAFTPQGVQWPDGTTEAVDVILFATGYRPHLPYLAATGALDANGAMLQRDGVSSTVPGLYYVGHSRQRNFASATLRGVGPDAEIVVSHLRDYIAPLARGRAAAGSSRESRQRVAGGGTADIPTSLPASQAGAGGVDRSHGQ